MGAKAKKKGLIESKAKKAMVGCVLPTVVLRSCSMIQSFVACIRPPIVHNVVAVAYDESHTGNIRLSDLAWVCHGKQNKREFAAPCTLKTCFNECRMTLNVFEKRRFVVTGAANEDIARFGLVLAFHYISQRMGVRLLMSGFRVTNIQATLYMRRPVNVKLLHETLPKSQYCPRKINMVTFKIRDPGVTFLVFPSGAVVMTGAKTRDELMAAFRVAVPFLAQFVLDSPPDLELDTYFESLFHQVDARIEPHWRPMEF